jgi:hypothetical protein
MPSAVKKAIAAARFVDDDAHVIGPAIPEGHKSPSAKAAAILNCNTRKK